MAEQTDYEKYRGKCKKFAEDRCKSDPNLTLVRGFYICPYWGEQQHWWCKDKKGNIIDPTAKQFPSGGTGQYIEFDGVIYCEYCGQPMREPDTTEPAMLREPYSTQGRFAFCSYSCHYNTVM